MIWELRDTPRFSSDEAELLRDGWEPFHGFQIGAETWVVFRRLRANDEEGSGWRGYAPVPQMEPRDSGKPLAPPKDPTWRRSDWEIETAPDMAWFGCALVLGSIGLVVTILAALIWWLA